MIRIDLSCHPWDKSNTPPQPTMTTTYPANPTATVYHGDLELGLPFATRAKYDPAEKWNYVSKVITWFTFELSFTALGCVASYVHRADVIPWVQDHPQYLWGAAAASLISLVVLMCWAKSRGSRLATFGVFLVSLTAMVAVAVLQYSPQTVMTAASGTVFISMSAALYAKRQAARGVDLEGYGPILGSMLWAVIFAGFISWAFGATWMQTGIAAASLVLFTLYLIYDVNQLYVKPPPTDPELVDGLLDSISIYLDVIEIFLNLLQLLGGNGDSEN